MEWGLRHKNGHLGVRELGEKHPGLTVFPLTLYVFGKVLAWYYKAEQMTLIIFIQGNLRLHFFPWFCIMEGFCTCESKFIINMQFIYTMKRSLNKEAEQGLTEKSVLYISA